MVLLLGDLTPRQNQTSAKASCDSHFCRVTSQTDRGRYSLPESPALRTPPPRGGRERACLPAATKNEHPPEFGTLSPQLPSVCSFTVTSYRDHATQSKQPKQLAGVSWKATQPGEIRASSSDSCLEAGRLSPASQNVNPTLLTPHTPIPCL